MTKVQKALTIFLCQGTGLFTGEQITLKYIKKKGVLTKNRLKKDAHFFPPVCKGIL
jgi:hypothetical protein